MTNDTRETCGFLDCGEHEASEAHDARLCGFGCICGQRRNHPECHSFAPDYCPSLMGAPLDHPAFEGAAFDDSRCEAVAS
ncbi:MAG TPA: hypothetical protein VFH73_23250 [Polyangia bacterium]|jgi:hypothetical protein|nr:hypothetical protein [Polyangia bacterium]